ncbi:hypothetical protein BN996_00183 [Haloferax massiliensis]|uniref:Uncharacterized protein n=1 Tax=Haloferax massiliensis TaxID=1476858 RepID=A0A0D6JLG1_9EURY|nr:hypothetical protein BN996_00183 [Haloferax massiliensis]
MSAHEELQMHLAQALTRTTEPDVQAHLHAALESCQELPTTPVACPACGLWGCQNGLKYTTVDVDKPSLKRYQSKPIF